MVRSKRATVISSMLGPIGFSSTQLPWAAVSAVSQVSHGTPRGAREWRLQPAAAAGAATSTLVAAVDAFDGAARRRDQAVVVEVGAGADVADGVDAAAAQRQALGRQADRV